MSGSSRVAELLKVTQRAAIQYCEEVRSITGLGSALQYKTISNYLALHISELPTPQRLAELIRTTQIKPPGSQPGSTKHSRSKGPKKGSRRGLINSLRLYHVDGQPGVLPHREDAPQPGFSDRERISQDRLDHCPHGVPLFKVCAICDPEKFRELNGFD